MYNEFTESTDIIKVGGTKLVNNQPVLLGGSFIANVPVELTPPASAPPGVITDIQVGLIQNAWGDGYAAYPNVLNPLNYLVRQEYIGGKTGGVVTMLDWLIGAHVPPGEAAYKGYAPGVGMVKANTVWPWYNPQTGTWKPVNAEDDFHVISMADAPSAIFPRYYNGIQQLPLLFGSHTSSFKTYVAASTTQNVPQFLPMALFGMPPEGRSDYLFYSQAFASWSLTYNLIGGAGFKFTIATSLSGWQRQGVPYMPQVNVVPASVGGVSPFAVWQ